MRKPKRKGKTKFKEANFKVKKKHFVQKVWAPLIINNHLYSHVSFLSFLHSPCSWKHFFDNIVLLKYQIKAKKEKQTIKVVISSFLEDKTMIRFFCKQYHAEIWSEILISIVLSYMETFWYSTAGKDR